MNTRGPEGIGTFNCPNCGAAAAPECESCAYCGSSLATKVCASCFGSVAIGMHRCPWCGSGADGNGAAAEANRKCPRCGINLSRMNVGDQYLNECERCGGLWVSKFVFQQICTREEDQEAVLGFEAVVEKGCAAPKPAPARAYIPCPECGKLMNHQQFAGCSRIVLDWCKEHGAWCDRNELHLIVQFIRDGGLKKARERERQKIDDEKARLREHQLSLSALSLHPNEGAYITSGWKEDSDSLLRILSSTWLDLNK